MAERAKADRRGSFWTTLPGLLTAMAAVLTALAGLVAALHGAGLLGGRATPAQAASLQAAHTGPALDDALSADAAATSGDDCIARMPADHRTTIEAGAREVSFKPSGSERSGLGIVRLTDDGVPVGAVAVRFFSAGEIFKILHVTDGQCRAIAEYGSPHLGGDREVLRNWHDLELRLAGRVYVLALGASGGRVDVGYFRRVE